MTLDEIIAESVAAGMVREYPGDRRYFVSENGHVYYAGMDGMRIARTCYAAGYQAVNIDGRWPYLHHVVAATFHGDRPAGSLTRHLNDNRHDNRAANLCYGTLQENCSDARKNKRTMKGKARDCSGKVIFWRNKCRDKI